MGYNYGEMFMKLGVPRMGRQGSGWCGINDQGVMVLMAHQNFFRKFDDAWFYIATGHPNQPKASIPAKRSLDMLDAYFEEGKDIILAIGIFKSDGEYTLGGKVIASEFKEATGSAANARMLYFDPRTGTTACEVMNYFNASDYKNDRTDGQKPKATVTVHPPGRPLPPGHPFAATRILFGVKKPQAHQTLEPQRDEKSST